MNYELFFFVGKIEMLSLTILPIYAHILSAPTMEQKLTEASSTATRHSNGLGGIGPIRQLYQRRAELKRRIPLGPSTTRLVEISSISHRTYSHSTMKNDYISDLHSQGLTYPLLRKMHRNRMNNKQKKEFYFVPTAIILKIKGDFRVMDGCLLLVNMVHTHHCRSHVVNTATKTPWNGENSTI